MPLRLLKPLYVNVVVSLLRVIAVSPAALTTRALVGQRDSMLSRWFAGKLLDSLPKAIATHFVRHWGVSDEPVSARRVAPP